MHIRRGAWRNVIGALALVTFALPLSAQVAAPANAQTVGTPPSVIPAGSSAVASFVAVTPAFAVNPLGTPHTTTFTCGTASGLFTLGVTGTNTSAPLGTFGVSTATGTGATVVGGVLTGPAAAGTGCYNVTATAQDITLGTQIPITGPNSCAGQPLTVTGGTASCGVFNSGSILQGQAGTGAAGQIVPCPAGATSASAVCTFNTTINPGAPHAYTITYSGYQPAICPVGSVFTPATFLLGAATPTPATCFVPGTTTSAFACPAGETLGATTVYITGLAAFVPGTAVCYFTVMAQKKYVEANTITLTPVSGCGTAPPLLYVEGLKGFLGTACIVAATITGRVVIKNGVNCATEPSGPSAVLTAEFGSANVRYECVNGSLAVVGIPLGAGIPVTFTVSGGAPGSFSANSVVGGVCAGTAGAAGTTTVNTGTGGTAVVAICPTGPGTGTVQACIASPINTQPALCSATVTFTFISLANRTVPQVRWAGEKIVLTKCFGIPASPVEFMLKGNNPGLNATLIPISVGLSGSGLFNPGAAANPTYSFAEGTDAVFATTDSRGCASVIGYADGEGVMYVDAAIYSAAGSGCYPTPSSPTFPGACTSVNSPIINEHAFEVFYLKFDRVDLENVTFSTYTTATALQPWYTGFLASSAAFGGASVFPTSFTIPGPPGSGQVAGPSGYSVPLCQIEDVRAMVHGYFEIPGDPSGRPASTVAVPNAPAGSAGSYVLPAGRWVLPEDWPLLATFAGFSPSGAPVDLGPSSVFAWDLNSGYAFNPTGERPDMCIGTFAPMNQFGNLTNIDNGPCFGRDAAGTDYSTAPGSGGAATVPNTICAGGTTVAFGSFDPTQSCTTPYPLRFSPPGSGILSGPPNCALAPCIAPVSVNSDYLPNGTLNQWDAPMPPAQVSFGITAGPGFLTQLNKTGFYEINFIVPASSTGTCPGGAYFLLSNGRSCSLFVDPNPFYSEAIPASPLIPPITNNGGYVWDSWGFNAGVAAVVMGVAPIAGALPGGFVPGQSTFVPFNSSCVSLNFLTGTIFTPTGGTSCTAPIAAVTGAIAGISAAGCTAAGGTVVGTTCVVPFSSATGNSVTTIAPGGINLTPTGAGCPAPYTATSVQVADARGFIVGQPLYDYDLATGSRFLDGYITAITPAPVGTTFPNAAVITFQTAPPVGSVYTIVAATFLGCQPAQSGVFYAGEFGLPVPNASVFTVGQLITVTPPRAGTRSATFQVVRIDTANSIVYVISADAAALELVSSSTCFGISRPIATSPGSTGATSSTLVGAANTPTGPCEPSTLAPPGTLVEGAAPGGTAPITGVPTNFKPYPFWQWLPAPQQASQAAAKSATVYSDNHGEAGVSLYTAIGLLGAQLPPINGACIGYPSAFTPVTVGGVVVSCNLDYTRIGADFSGIAAALAAFSAAKPGCIMTFTSGTSAVLPGVTVGATGPAPGQICINSLGGIEFGASASLGSTTVQAVAEYPYTRGEHPAISSALLTKVFSSAFAKSLSVSAGSPGPANTTAYTVTVTALDVCGNPITSEPVNVYALGNAGASVLAPVGVGAIISTSNNSATVIVNPATGTATLALEVLNTAIGTQGLVIKAVWPYERIERFVTVIPGTTPGQTATVVYPPGWQQIGGPPGSNFSVVEALFNWNAATQSYANATAAAGNLSSAAPGCTGYWAYFAAAMSVNLPATSKAGDTAQCSLANGWNLVGNPFASPARITGASVAYHWNGTSYDNVSLIPTGGSVWIFSNGTSTVTLTAT